MLKQRGKTLKGVSGIGRLTRIDPELFPAKVAAEINDFEVEKYIDKKKRAVWIALHNMQ